MKTYDWLVEHVELFESLSNSAKIGLYPGAFKPPHVGHYEAAVSALSKNDFVFVLISGQGRGEGPEKITGKQSKQIWDIYKQSLGDDRLKVVLVPNNVDPLSEKTSTVISATYDVVHLLNNSGEFDPAGKFMKPHPIAQKIYNRLEEYDKFVVTVYAGAEDFKGRYSGFPFKEDDIHKRYKGKNVVKIKKGLNKRLASASGIRPYISSYRQNDAGNSNKIREKILAGALKYDDFASIRKNLPGDEDVKDEVIDVLLK